MGKNDGQNGRTTSFPQILAMLSKVLSTPAKAILSSAAARGARAFSANPVTDSGKIFRPIRESQVSASPTLQS